MQTILKWRFNMGFLKFPFYVSQYINLNFITLSFYCDVTLFHVFIGGLHLNTQ